MLQSSAPVPLQLPFASAAGAGYTRAIPVASQIAITPGAASFTDGFPPINFLDPVLGGGIPFSGQDVNGVLNAITNALQWEQLNGSAAYNALVATAISGYPNGTILKRTGAPGYWQSTVDNNNTNPDTGGAGWQGFNPIDGITTLALTTGTATLTAAQYGNPIIVLTGSLSGNVNLVLPATIGRWTISNKCTGAFTVTCSTAAGPILSLPLGTIQPVFCDGVNVFGAYTPLLYIPFGAAIAGNVTLTAAQSGMSFDASSGVITLPAVASGLRFRFIGVSSGAAVLTAGSAPLYYPDATYITSGNSIALRVGSTFEIICDGTNWFITNTSGQVITKAATASNQAVNLGQFQNSANSFGFPSGYVVKFGQSTSIAASSNGSFTFPVAFPNGCLVAFVNPIGVANIAQGQDGILTYTATGVTWSNQDNVAHTFMILAIGN